jgi:hypothetical protein
MGRYLVSNTCAATQDEHSLPEREPLTIRCPAKNRLSTLIIGSWESIQATTRHELLSLRVRPGYGLGVGSIIR